MAKPKASPPDPKTKPKKHRPERVVPAADAAEKYDPSADRRTLLAIIARQGTVDADHRAAFDSLIDDAGRLALGNRTRSSGVFRDAVAWAVVIDRAFRDYTAAVESYYSKPRFAYYLDRCSALDAAIVAQSTDEKGRKTGKVTVADKSAALRKLRGQLLFRLERYAGQRKDECEALDKAKGRADDDDALGESVLQMVKLGRAWLQRTDTTSVILASTAGLTPAFLDSTMAGAEALTGAATDVKQAGKGRAVDRPEVNVVEGSVLFEMAEAQACFARAREEAPLLPNLVAGAATRALFGPRKTKAVEAQAATPANGAPAPQPAADPPKPAEPTPTKQP